MEKDFKPQSKKRVTARLSPEQHKLMEDLIINERWSDAQIARQMSIKVERVAYFRRNVLGINKDLSGTIVIKQESSTKGINTLSVGEEEKRTNWSLQFRSTHRYNRLKSQLTATDLDYFVHEWAVYHMQLEDMSASEEDTLENMIILKVRINENQKSFKQTQEHEEQLKEQLGHKTNQQLDLENDAERMLYELIMSNNRVKVELNKEYKELSAQVDKIQESLAMTRKQREEKKSIGGDTFISLCKMMNDRDIRKSIGLYNERMKAATEKKTQELKNNYTFADGTIEPLLLDGADFKDLKEPTDE